MIRACHWRPCGGAAVAAAVGAEGFTAGPGVQPAGFEAQGVAAQAQVPPGGREQHRMLGQIKLGPVGAAQNGFSMPSSPAR
jgi:hypothetical protein